MQENDGTGSETGELELTVERHTMKRQRGFTVEHVERELRDDEIVNALILSSTLLENVFSRFIQRRLSISQEEFNKLWGRSSLGRYFEICQILNALPEEPPKPAIQNLIEHRNGLVHEASFLEDIVDDEDKQTRIKSDIRRVTEYIDSIEFDVEYEQKTSF